MNKIKSHQEKAKSVKISEISKLSAGSVVSKENGSGDRLNFLDLLKDVVNIQVRVMFVGRFYIGMAHHATEHLRSNACSDCSCGEGVAAVVGGHVGAADLIHEMFKISLTEIDGVSVAIISVYETSPSRISGSPQQFLISGKPDLGYNDSPANTSLCFGSANEVIIVAVFQRYFKEFVGAGTSGNQHKHDYPCPGCCILN